MTPPYNNEIVYGKGLVELGTSFDDELVLETFADKAVEYINKVTEDAKKGKPFFLYLPLTSPLVPHCTHPDFHGRSDCGNYGDFMEETDYRIGLILDALADNKLEENTLVIFTSDNGAEKNYIYQRDTFSHYSSLHFKGGKRDIYEGGHRVPFLLRWPAVIKSGRKIDIPVCQTDYLSTIAEIIGAEIPEDVAEDSYSLYPALKEEDFDKNLRGAVVHHSSEGYLAIRDGQWKLNMLRGSGGTLKPKLIQPKEGEAIYELYNIDKDPGETTNLYFEHPEIVERLTQQLTKIIKEGRSTPGTPQDYVKENWGQINWME
jgi:arylsulfatase A